MRTSPCVRTAIGIGCLCLLLGACPSAGAAPGKTISLLVLSDNAKVDEAYEKQLAAEGYRVTKTSFTGRLSAAYLRQFQVIVLTRLPYAGQEYGVGGHKLAPLAANLALVHDYVAAGGGVLVEPAMSEFGEAYAEVYNAFLKRYDVKYLPQQLRHDAETKGAYAAGEVRPGHAITKGLAAVLYPINVLRWDHAYSTTPIVCGREWTVLAAGKKGAGTHQAVSNNAVGPRLTANRSLLAVRRTGKGRLAISAIHSYYTLTHVSSKAKNLGENSTGIIDGIAMRGEKGGRRSDLGALLARTVRYLAAGSAAAGMGGAVVELPEQPGPPKITRVIDWRTAEPPPSWQHRVIPIWKGPRAYYDNVLDPDARGKVQFYKMLVGPRTA